ncbi:MAG TPA: STAS domain-containing protein [Nannocystis sp.]
MATEDPRIEIDGVVFVWDRARDLFLINGMPAVGLLVESTVAQLLVGVERMVGLERFNLALQAAGRDSVAGEWEGFISKMPSVREGLEMIGQVAPLGGLGRWQLLELDVPGKIARFRVTAGWEPMYQQAAGVAFGSSFLAGKFAGYCTRAFGTYCWAEQTASVVHGDAYDEFVVRPSDSRLEARLEDLQSEGKATASDLASALKRLQHEAQERSRAEAGLREQLAVVERQAEAIRTMSSPILRVWSGVLAMPVVGRVDATRAARMMEDLLSAVTSTRARWTILDLTGVDTIDAAALHEIMGLVRAVALLGARCLLSGMSPTVATTAVELGVDLAGLASHATLESALQVAMQAMQKTQMMQKTRRPQG